MNMKVKVEMTPEEMIVAVQCYEELKAYRKTGYTPEQITELHDKHWMECMQIAHYDNDLNSNRGWIPCSERLPENCTPVLVHAVDKRTDTEAVYAAYFENGKGWASIFDGKRMQEYFIKPFYWMPLPEPPAEKEVQT